MTNVSSSCGVIFLDQTWKGKIDAGDLQLSPTWKLFMAVSLRYFWMCMLKARDKAEER